MAGARHRPEAALSLLGKGMARWGAAARLESGHAFGALSRCSGSGCSTTGRSIRGRSCKGGPVIGLLGGSFNPAHGGHRKITLFAMQALGLDQCWWLVSPGNPLKPKKGMAPLGARVRSAQRAARLAPIKVTAIERELGTRFTIDTVKTLSRRYPKLRFVWLMGADNLAQFHLWKDWRAIAEEMPIAVIARPGYDRAALASPAKAWLRRYRLSAAQFRNREGWSAPALIELRFDPDPRSATAVRLADPLWASRCSALPPRDGLTHSSIHEASVQRSPQGPTV